jgi:hypothetical protein
MRLCRFALALAFAAICLANGGDQLVGGKLTQRDGQPPALETADHKLISLDGDVSTKGVLNDKRLAGANLEIKGHFAAADRFIVNPIHTHAMLVVKNGKHYAITYWCDTCAIRTYTPGICVCCQQETQLDLRDPDKE